MRPADQRRPAADLRRTCGHWRQGTHRPPPAPPPPLPLPGTASRQDSDTSNQADLKPARDSLINLEVIISSSVLHCVCQTGVQLVVGVLRDTYIAVRRTVGRVKVGRPAEPACGRVAYPPPAGCLAQWAATPAALTRHYRGPRASWAATA